jgi:hypothetical protein
MVISGNTASTTSSAVINIAANIISYSLCNKSGGSITASIGIVYGSTITYILYNEPLAAAGTATCNYIYLGEKIGIAPNRSIFISVSGSCDYYLTIE